jgi:hypothetical protein
MFTDCSNGKKKTSLSGFSDSKCTRPLWRAELGIDTGCHPQEAYDDGKFDNDDDFYDATYDFGSCVM